MSILLCGIPSLQPICIAENGWINCFLGGLVVEFAQVEVWGAGGEVQEFDSDDLIGVVVVEHNAG